MKKFATLVLAAVLVMPSFAAAATTYQYVDVNGVVRTVVADNTVQARERSTNVNANTIFTAVYGGGEETPSYATEADLLDIIASLQERIQQLTALLNQKEGGKNTNMANDSQREEDSAEVKQEKKDLKEKRGVGRAQANLYIDDSEDDADGKDVRLSITDFYEGDQVDVEAPVQPSDESDKCEGRVAGSSLKTCSKELTYRIDGQTTFKVSINGEERSLTIAPGGNNRLVNW